MSTDPQPIIDTAIASTLPHPLDAEGRLYSVVLPGGEGCGGSVEVIDVEDYRENHRARPRRKTGTYRVHDANSFVAYLGKHGLDESEVWVSAPDARMVGVINAHESVDGPAGWGDHRVQYDVRKTDAWQAWTALDGKLVDQATFAEHIEDRSVDIVEPTAADMLELAETFQATIGVNFRSSKLLSSGERQFEYREDVDAKAGRSGQLAVPKQFTLALRPFEGAEPYRVTARFRYRMTQGALQIGYRLERPEDVMRDAFLGVVAAIEERVTHPIYRGTSA